MNLVGQVALCFVVISCTSVPKSQNLTDESENSKSILTARDLSSTYEEQVESWNTPEDISRWMGKSFSYDRPRALLLSETQRSKKEKTAIYTPSELYLKRSGVCIDLTRFAVETAKKIDSGLEAKYLMIEFEPIEVDGNILRLHWIATYTKNGKFYFYGDSKRPEFIAGPYESTDQFLKEYEKFRGRKVISHKVLDSFEKSKKRRTTKS